MSFMGGDHNFPRVIACDYLVLTYDHNPVILFACRGDRNFCRVIACNHLVLAAITLLVILLAH